MKMNSLRLAHFTALTATMLLPSGLVAQTFVQPYAATFSPTGTSGEPWTLLNAAVDASRGGVVQILGGNNIYGTNRIDKPCKLTRTSESGTVKIGTAPIASTTYRCISYNARLNGQVGSVGAFNFLPYGWADAQRTEAIRQKVGSYSPDFAGFCEVWNSDWYDRNGAGLKYIAGLPYGMSGFDYKKFETHHSGLCAVSKTELVNPQQVAFANYTGEDQKAAKGSITASTVKDKFEIVVIMTHTQADSSVLSSWNGIFTARRKQIEQLVSEVALYRLTRPSAVVVLMGDFNVYGENRTPSNTANVTSEYSSNMKTAFESALGIATPAPRDVAKQFSTQRVNHTYSYDTTWGQNSLIKYFDSGYDTPTYSGRLDYFFVWNSFDGKVIIEPTDYQVLKLMSDVPITSVKYPNAGNHIDSNLSDHYAIMADFRIMRISN